MADDSAPRSGRGLAVVLLACLVWLGVAATPVALRLTGDLAGALDLAAAVLPPIVAATLAIALTRRPAEAPHADVEERLAAASSGVATIEERLRVLDEALGGSLALVERMAGAAATQGGGLGASATALGLAAAELVNAGEEATGAATTLSGQVSDLGRQVGELDATLHRLGIETANQLLAIDTVLARVGVRNREAAAEAAAAVAAISRQLGAVDERSQETTEALAKRAYALDAAIDGVLERSVTVFDGIGARVATEVGTLETRLDATRAALERAAGEGAQLIGERIDLLTAAAAQLQRQVADQEAHGRGLVELTDTYLAALPDRLERARRGSEATLNELAARVGLVHRNLEGLQTPAAASEAALGAIGAQLDLLRRVADELGVGLAGRLPATVAELRNLDVGAVALVQRFDELRETLQASGEATRTLREMVGATRIEMATLGEADARQVGDRLETLIVATGDLGDRIAAQRLASEEAGAAIGAQLDVAQARLHAVEADSKARLAEVAEHVGGVHGAIDRLADPLRASRSVLDDMDAQLEHFGLGVADVGAALDGRVAALVAALATLTGDAGGLLDRTAALHKSIGDGAAAIGGAADAFGRERQALIVDAEMLAGHFDRARSVLGELRGETAGVSDDARARLVPVFEQAHALAEQGAAAMQDMLAKVVADATAALEMSGSAVAETAFTAPIRTQLEAITAASTRAGDTAEVAASRIAEQAGALTVAIETVEAKVAELEVRIDVRDRDTLSARSARLIEQLGEASVDVAQLLQIDVGETAWAEYLGGDRSVFARRTVRLLDRELLRKIARHYRHDPAFEAEASRYVDTFERLTRRVLDDPDGEALMATMLSSDLGKLYVAIAQAIGRFAPRS